MLDPEEAYRNREVQVEALNGTRVEDFRRDVSCSAEHCLSGGYFRNLAASYWSSIQHVCQRHKLRFRPSLFKGSLRIAVLACRDNRT